MTTQTEPERPFATPVETAFLKYIQRDNKCRTTGRSCDAGFHRCGCVQEMKELINAERI